MKKQTRIGSLLLVCSLLLTMVPAAWAEASAQTEETTLWEELQPAQPEQSVPETENPGAQPEDSVPETEEPGRQPEQSAPEMEKPGTEPDATDNSTVDEPEAEKPAAPAETIPWEELQPARPVVKDTRYIVHNQEEFAAAIAKIEEQQDPEAVIALAEDISVGNTPITVEGKKITITSSDEAVYQLSNGSFSLSGDLTLDKIRMSGGEHKRIFACGHTFETTENFEGYVYTDSSGEENYKIDAIFGGGNQQDVAEGGTNVILRGKGVYEWTIAGGLDSIVHGDTNILIDGAGINVGNLTGGGYADKSSSGQVYGDTHVTVRQGTARSILGGGRGNWKDKTDKESARVYGDTWVVTGGGESPAYIGTATQSCAGSEYSTVNNTHFIAMSGTDATRSGAMEVIGGGLNDVVLGTTYVEISGDAKIGTVCGGAVGNHDANISHTIIKNENEEPYAVHVVYDSTADCGSGIYAGAPNAGQSVIHGNVLVEVKQGPVKYVNLDDAYTDGDSRSPGAQIDGDATLIVTGGDIGQIVGCAAHEQADSLYHSYVIYDGCGTQTAPQKSGYLYKFKKITLKNHANVKIDSDEFADFGGAAQKPFYSVQNLEIVENSALTTRASYTVVSNDVTMDQGSWRAKGRTWVYENLNSSNSELLFEDYLAIGYNHRSDDDPTLVTSFVSSGDKIVLLENDYADKICGNAELTNSDLTLLAPLNVVGNWKGGASLLRLPVTTDNNYTDQKVSPGIPLNINGMSTGMCKVRTVKPDNADRGETAQMPAVGDNYVTDWQAEGQTDAVFVLENADALAQGLYLKKVVHPANSSYDMWQVAKREPDEKITIQYQWVGTAPGDAVLPETITMYPVPFVAAEKPATAETGFTFDGWFTDEDCTVKFVDGTMVDANMVLYGQWKKSTPPGPPNPPTPPTPPTPPEPPAESEDPAVPLTPLEPAEAIIPLIPLEPAEEVTPLIPLKPAEDVVVPEKPDDSGEYHGPKTGDNDRMLYALMGMILCAVGTGLTLLYRRKKD